MRTKLQRSGAYLFIIILILIAPPVLQGATLTDDEGRTLTLNTPFSRIISLYPAHTENLAYLGCEDLLIGIGTADNYPEEISQKPRFDYRDNTEKFLAAAPDLIIIRPMISRSQPELIQKLRDSGITVVSLQPTTIEEMFAYWQKLGQLTGRSTQAEEMINHFNESLHRLRTHLPADMLKRPRVYFESIHSKMKTFAPEAISIFALTEGGGRNVAVDASGRNDSNIAPYGKERILAKAQDIDVFLSQVGRMNRVNLDEIYNEPGFQLIKAIQNKSVFLIDEDVVSRPTMRLLAGISTIQSLLYPSLEHNPKVLANQETVNKPQPKRQ